jgi:hypothetical protein
MSSVAATIVMHVGPVVCLPADGMLRTACARSVFALDPDDFLSHSYRGTLWRSFSPSPLNPQPGSFRSGEQLLLQIYDGLTTA